MTGDDTTKDVSSEGFTIRLPKSWAPVGENGPYGVSPNDGKGYLQFCVAFAAGGRDQGQAMLDMVLTMAKGYDMGQPCDLVTENHPLPLGAASFVKDGEFCRMWELKQGANLVSAVFVCREGEQFKHLPECESIVRSARTSAVLSSKIL
jgi:hypothetical protein